MHEGRGRRQFVKTTAAGLAALGGMLGSGCDAASDASSSALRLDGALKPEEANLFRYVLGRTELPIAAWDATLAAAKLANDIFTDRVTASRFASDPHAYLAAQGLPHVKLDPSAIEVRLAATFGDPEARALVAARDYAGFLAFLEKRGLLDQMALGTSEGADSIRAMYCRDPELCGGGGGGAVYVVAFVFLVVAVTYVTVAYTAAAVMMVETVAGVDTEVATTGRGAFEYRRAPALALLAALGGEQAAEEAAEVYLGSTVDRIAAELERSTVYRERGGPIGEELRELIRRKLALAMALPN